MFWGMPTSLVCIFSPQWSTVLRRLMMISHEMLFVDDSCCHVVTWNAQTFFPFCLSVSSLDVNKKQPGLEKICVLLSRFFRDGRWSVQVPCVSQLQPQSPLLPVRHASAWWCCVLLRPASSQYSSLLAYLQCILSQCESRSVRASERIGCFMEWLEVAQLQQYWYSMCAEAAFSALSPAVHSGSGPLQFGLVHL